MLISTESDSEADDADATVLRCLAELEPGLIRAWKSDPDGYNADLFAILTPENSLRSGPQ
jgi:hypothetical protein